ncbi:Oidioi.mRNA.OKI2018_I69.PAR.g8775.t1.cds [Oikopleura dioica]|uniref:Oidioi.mRNA.OKI2018_I69.PAR.g8775.t1.cds n=1 Tax=Oikopleura dioica TaxID=34765 RepID=A0ABN7RLR9_OIKDI|nr:Oidioi.mRNA.OKI2018_I69.PAR.g8775.t1.cds [Oikopleura dioica]
MKIFQFFLLGFSSAGRLTIEEELNLAKAVVEAERFLTNMGRTFYGTTMPDYGKYEKYAEELSEKMKSNKQLNEMIELYLKSLISKIAQNIRKTIDQENHLHEDDKHGEMRVSYDRDNGRMKFYIA